MPQTLTDWREYRRGLPPPDWTPLWGIGALPIIAGIECDGGHRNRLLHSAGVLGATGAFGWQAPESDAGHGQQEILDLIRVGPDGHAIYVLALRAATAGSGYLLEVTSGAAGSIRLLRKSGGVAAAVATASGLAIPPDTWQWVRFAINPSTITLAGRIWEEFGAEPGSPTASGVDGAGLLADGMMAICAPTLGPIEHRFFSVGTGGDPALGPTSLPRSMEVWSLDPAVQVEITAELDTWQPDDHRQQTEWISSMGRFTLPNDYPPTVNIKPLLADMGSWGETIEQVVAFSGVTTPRPRRGFLPTAAQLASGSQPGAPSGAALERPSSLVMRNERGQSNFLFDRTVAGRLVAFRAGEARAATHRAFEVIGTAMMSDEPEIGDRLQIALAAALPGLAQNLRRRYYAGIPTCLDNSGSASYAGAGTSTAQSITTFTAMVRFRCRGATAPTADAALFRKIGATYTDFQFTIYVESVGANAGHLRVISSIGGVASALDYTSPVRVDDSAYHVAWLGIAGSARAYLLLDGALLFDVALTADPATGGAPVINYSHNAQVLDCRLYNYLLEPEQALAASTKAEDPGAAGLVGYWRCDDAAGTVVTDYSATANHATWYNPSGAPLTWQPSDLGEPSWAGKPMPLAYGALFNAEAQRADSVRERYRINDGAVVDMLASYPPVGGGRGLSLNLKSQGVALSPATDWTEPGDGVLDLSAAQSQPLTFDLARSAAPTVNAQLVTAAQRCLADRGAQPLASPAQVDGDAFEVLRRLLPYDGGFFADAEITGAQVLEDALSPIGAHYRQDRAGRIVPGILVPPVTPGPYGMQPALEFLGYDSGGVTWEEQPLGASLAASATFAAAQTILFWARFADLNADPTLSAAGLIGLGAGQALIDATDPGETKGIYAGLDAIRGAFVFGTPGALGSGGGGLDFSSAPSNFFRPGTWYLIACQAGNDPSGGGSLVRRISAAPQGASAMTPLAVELLANPPVAGAGAVRFGGGRRRGLRGALAQVACFSSFLSQSAIAAYLAVAPKATDAGCTWLSALNEGHRATTVTEQISGRQGSLLGVRWCPRFSFDLTARDFPAFAGVKKLRPSWHIDVGYGRNYKVMSDSEISAGLTGTARDLVKLPISGAPYFDLELPNDYQLAREALVGTGLARAADAAQLLAMLANRLKPGRMIAQLAGARVEALPLQVGDEVWLYSLLYHHILGRAYRVLSRTARPMQRSIDLGLWGGSSLLMSALTIDSTTGEPLTIDSTTGEILNVSSPDN